MLVRTSKTQPCARASAVELPQCRYFVFGSVVFVLRSEDGWDRRRIAAVTSTAMRNVAARERIMRVLEEVHLYVCCCSRVGGSSESASISSFDTAVSGGGFDLRSLANTIV